MSTKIRGKSFAWSYYCAACVTSLSCLSIAHLVSIAAIAMYLSYIGLVQPAAAAAAAAVEHAACCYTFVAGSLDNHSATCFPSLSRFISLPFPLFSLEARSICCLFLGTELSSRLRTTGLIYYGMPLYVVVYRSSQN